MINPLSIVTGIAMAAIIGHTFEVKRSVGALDRELRDIRRSTDEVETRTQTLAAEWARLNDQERLRGLAERHLGQMVPMQPMQFVRLDEGVRRMPSALAWAGEASPFAARRDHVAVAQAAPAAAAPVQLAGAAPSQPAIVTSGPTAANTIRPAPAAPPASARPMQLADATPARSTHAEVGPARPAAEPMRVPAPARATPMADAGASRSVSDIAPARPSLAEATPLRPVAEPARPPAPPRSLQLADAAPARPPIVASPRAVPVVPEAVARPATLAVMPPPPPANALPPVAAPPSGLARPAGTPVPNSPRAPAVAMAAAVTRPADGAALPPARTALLQRVDTGSLLGGQAVAMAPPVPWGR